MMLADGNGFLGWPGWAGVGVFAGVVVGLLTVWFAAKGPFRRRRLEYSWQHTSVVTRELRRQLRVEWSGDGGTNVVMTNPTIINIRLVNRSSADLTSAMFDEDRPLIFELGTQVVALLGAPPPKVRAMDEGVALLPGHIRKKQTIDIAVLVDGHPSLAVPDPPLIDVRVLKRDFSPAARPVPPAYYWLVAVIVTAAATVLAGYLANR